MEREVTHKRTTQSLAILCALVALGCASKDVASSGAIESGLVTKQDTQQDASYQVQLREYSLSIPALYEDRRWTDVTNEIEEDGPPIVEDWSNGDALHRYYLIEKDSYLLPSGHNLDLHLQVSAWNEHRGSWTPTPGDVYAANAALVSDVNLPYADLIKEDLYPHGSALDLVVRSEDVAEVGAVWPIVTKVFAYYGYFNHHRREFNSSGFFVKVEFTASMTEEVAGKRMSFFVPSGLDQMMSHSGAPMTIGEFESSDTLLGVNSGGGNEWWQGTENVVEANKEKYLLKN